MARILIITHQLSRTGAPIVLLNMVSILSDAGHDLSFISMSDGPMFDDFSRYGNVEIQSRFLDDKVSFQQKCTNYDFVICNSLISFEAVYALADTTTPVIWWIHEQEVYFNYFASVLLDFSKFEGSNIHVYAVSPLVQTTIFERFNCNAPLLSIAIEDSPLKANRKANNLNLLCIGAYSPAKGQDILCDAFELLSDEMKDKVSLTFIGNEDEYDAEIFSKVTSLVEKHENVRKFLPMPHDDVLNMMEASDILVVPSRYDSLSAVTAEMLMKEGTVILTNKCGISDYMTNNIDGIILEPENPQTLASAIVAAINNEIDLTQLGKSGRQVYEKHFKKENISREYLTLADSLTEESIKRKRDAQTKYSAENRKMKVLIYRYNSICEPDIIQGFQELGLDVDSFDWEITHKDTSPSELTRMVGEYIMDNPCDMVFSVNFYPFLSELCNIFHIRYFSWTVDSPVLEIFSSSISNEWNRTFLFDKLQQTEVQQYNPGKIFWLPLAANVKNKEILFQKTTAACHEKFSHDISFVGSLYSEKNPYASITGLSPFTKGYLDGIMSSQEQVYGYFFLEELLPDSVIDEFFKNCPGFSNYGDFDRLTNRQLLAQFFLGQNITAKERQHLFECLTKDFDVDIYTYSDITHFGKRLVNHGGCKTLTEMPLVFKNSKINLNPTSKSIRSGIPLRVFDIMSCGGFLLTNYQSELLDLFNINEHFVAYGSLEEAVELCHYYLGNESKRAEIAQAGLDAIKAAHTYEFRLAQMLKMGWEV